MVERNQKETEKETKHSSGLIDVSVLIRTRTLYNVIYYINFGGVTATVTLNTHFTTR